MSARTETSSAWIRPGARRTRGLKPLEEARQGESVTVVSVFERDRGLLEFLDSQGIRPGARFSSTAAGSGIEARVNRRTVKLDRAAASRIWVR